MICLSHADPIGCFRIASVIISLPLIWSQRSVRHSWDNLVDGCIYLIFRSRYSRSHRSNLGDADIVSFRPSFNSRYNRLDRLKYHTQRWKGPMSFACFIQLKEFDSFVKSISSYFGLPIVFTVYIPLTSKEPSYYVRGDGTKMVFNTTLYPVNLLRDLSIESIHTTHYLNIDADLFVSSSVVGLFYQ